MKESKSSVLSYDEVSDLENQDEPCTICTDKINEVKDTFQRIKDKGIDPLSLFDPSLSDDEIARANIKSQEFYKDHNVEEDRPQINRNNKFYIKTFLFSANINLNDWGVTIDSLHKNIYTFIGQPIVLTPNFDHPDNGKEYDTYENTIKFQEDFRVGTIIDILYEKGTYYAIAEITDEKTRALFRDHKIPMFVSPGIMHNEKTIRKSNWTGIHLAIVDRPAFTTQKALIKGTCEGDLKLCMMQLSTASLKENTPTIVFNYKDQEQLDNILLAYYNNIMKLSKHNDITLLKQNTTDTFNKMVENNDSSTNNTNVTSTIDSKQPEIKNPSIVPQKTEYDLNMCVAQFIERGLDSNTAREICVTALGTQGGMGGDMGGGQGGGGFGGQGGGNPQQQGNRGYISDSFYNTIANLINTKNTVIHTLKAKVDNYEKKFQETVGFTLDEQGIKQIQEWKQKEEQNRKDALKQSYIDHLKLYSTNEEQINLEAEEYINNNFSLESVKNIYSKRQTLEQIKEGTKQTEATKTDGTSTKPHEMFNEMKKGTNTETQDNRLQQKSTASENEPKLKVNSVLLDKYSLRINENTSNNIQKGDK